MTFTQTGSLDVAPSQSVPQHHLKAAELQVQIARDHVALAGAHVIEARKTGTPMLSAGI